MLELVLRSKCFNSVWHLLLRTAKSIACIFEQGSLVKDFNHGINSAGIMGSSCFFKLHV